MPRLFCQPLASDPWKLFVLLSYLPVGAHHCYCRRMFGNQSTRFPPPSTSKHCRAIVTQRMQDCEAVFK
eukprot:7075283-Pyramimonas_sp.AAC.1